MTDRVICGWRVRSEFPLPETAPWSGPDSPVDITIASGPVPARLGERAAELPYMEAAPDGRLMIDAAPIVRFLVTRDRVVVETSLAADAPEWRASLLGPVLAIICYLRGALPLHASALRIGHRVAAFAGRSGAGKSTLAAALARRGHSLITDDICACIGFPGPPLVLPSYPGMKLSLASLDALHIERGGLRPIGPDFEKVQWTALGGFDAAPALLDRVYLLEDATQDHPSNAIIATSGAEGFQRLSTEIYRPPMGRLLLDKPRFFAMAAELARQVSIRRLVRRRDLDTLDSIAAAIEADLATE
jgi:hypothetical protein